MKIEIDADELFDLKKQVEKLVSENREIRNKLISIDETAISERVKRASYTMFHSYVNAVFKSLDFDQFEHYHNKHPVIFSNQMFEEDWPNREDLHVSLEAELSEKFKRAFLRIGVKI